MDKFLCPGCRVGKLQVVVQVQALLNEQGLTTDAPGSDDFIQAYCNNDACQWALAQDPGDGRLRNADLYSDYDSIDLEPADGNAELRAAFIAAVYTMFGERS